MDAQLVNPFITAVETVLPQMGFPEPKRTAMSLQEKSVVGQGVSILIGFTKQLRGNIVYNMPEATAKKIASQMMMGMEVAELDAMAQSAISEMSNMISASAATNLASAGHEVDISTPNLTIGTGFKLKISDGPYLSVKMDVGGQPLELDIAVAVQG